MIKIMPKLTGSDAVDKEVLRILSNTEGLTANEICDTFYIPCDSYYYYRDLTPLIRIDMDLKRKNELRNQAYKIATDAIDMHTTLLAIKGVAKKIIRNEFNKTKSSKQIQTLELQLEKLGNRKYHLDSLIQYYHTDDTTLYVAFDMIEEIRLKRIKEKTNSFLKNEE